MLHIIFITFRNNVWGVGPKIGGNSAGLLNFGRLLCPYNLITPWEFGTRRKSKQRQVDYQLQVACLDQLPGTDKKVEGGNATANSANTKVNLYNTPFKLSSSTTSQQKIDTENGVPGNQANISNSSSTTNDFDFPGCGGVRAVAAIDNIFGKGSIIFTGNIAYLIVYLSVGFSL